MSDNKKKKISAKKQAEEQARLAQEKKKKIITYSIAGAVVVLAIVLVLILTLGGNGKNKGGQTENPDTIRTTGYTYVEMSVKGYGKIILKLDHSAAPYTVDNFVSLVNRGFYDGLTFHRIIKDFMIQGGDPKANGTGGNTDANGNEINIKGEFSSNGHNNPISHKRGVISMARSNDPDSASSQFFICNADASASLDGQYAAFGWVIEGMDVVDAITDGAFPKTDYYDYYGNYETDPIYGLPKHYVWQYLGNGTLSNKADQPVIEYIKVLPNYAE